MRQLFTFLLATMLWPVISFSQNNPEFKTYKQGDYAAEAFTTNNFKCIAVGKGNLIWAGTQYGGLYMYSDTADIWRKSDQLANVFINDIKADADSGIWIGQSGTQSMGGNSNIAGGVNYFRVASDLSMEFYSVQGTTTQANLVSRNVRSLYLDQSYREATGSLPRPWVASGTYITSRNTKKGGLNIGLNEFWPYFNEVQDSLDNRRDATPMCEAIGGDNQEVWVAVRQNFGKSQILRYNPTGKCIGTYSGVDTANSPLPVGFTAQAIFADERGNRWIGLKSGGLVIKTPKNGWLKMNWESLVPPGTAINNNAIISDEFGNIYIGTSNGLLEFESQKYNPLASPDNPNNYKRYTDLNGLPSNNITGLAYDKKNGNVLITSSGGVTFMNKKEPHIRGVVFDVYCAIDSANPYTGLQQKPLFAGVTVKLFYNGEEKESIQPLTSGVFELVEAEDNKNYTVEVSYLKDGSTIKFVYNNIRNHTLMTPVLVPDSLMGELRKFKKKMVDRVFPVALTFGIPIDLKVEDCFNVEDYDLALEPFKKPSGITKDHDKVVYNLANYYASLATVYDLGGKVTDLSVDAITNLYDGIVAIKQAIVFHNEIKEKAKALPEYWVDPYTAAKVEKGAQASILTGTVSAMKTMVEMGLKKISGGLSAYPKEKAKLDRYITAWGDATDLLNGISDKLMKDESVSGALTDAFWGNIKKVLIQEVAMQYYKLEYAQSQHKDFVFRTSNYSKYGTSESTYSQAFDQLYNPNSNSLVKFGKDTVDNRKSTIEKFTYAAKFTESATAIADALTLLAIVPGGQIVAAGAKVVSSLGRVLKPAFLAGAMYIGVKGTGEIEGLSDKIIEKSGFITRNQTGSMVKRNAARTQKSPDALIASKNNYNQKLTDLQVVYNASVYDPINYGNKYREFIAADSQYNSEMNKTISALSASNGNALVAIPGYSDRLDIVIDSFVTQQYSRRYALYFQNMAFLYDSSKIDDVPELNSLANEIKILNDSAINGIVSLISLVNDNNITAPAYLAQDSYVMDHDNVPGTAGSVTYNFTNYGTEPQNNVSFKIGEFTEGFSLTSADLIKFATIQPGETKQMSFTFMSPPSTDSFTIGKYHITVSADNGVFNDVSGAMYIFKPASTTPVRLSKFNASCINAGAKITWQTASEENSSHFEIEKSTDGFSWALLENLKAAGNSNLKRDYEFIDLKAGTAFYRLKQIDKDGKFTYSDIRRVGCKVQNTGLSVYPIPAQNILNVAINASENATVKVLLIDLTGRVIQRFDTNLKNGINHLQLNVEGMAAGQYLLNVNGSKISKTQKVTIGQ